MVRDLALFKEAAEILASRLKGRGVFYSDARLTLYRKRDQVPVHCFSKKDDFVFCNYLSSMGLPEYKSNEWHLLIDSCKRSHKCVLFYNSYKFGSVVVGHSVILKEQYLFVKMVLKKLPKKEHNWVKRVELKIYSILLGK